MKTLKLQIAVSLAAIVLVSGIILAFAYAAGVTKSIEAEDATPNGTSVQNDPSASASKALSFMGAAPPVAQGCATNGTGGTLTDATDQSYSGSAGTAQYHLFGQGLPTDKPLGLMLQFHGDGAEEFDNLREGTLEGYAEQAKQREMLLIAIRTPDSGTVTWWEDGGTNAEWVRDFLENEIYPKYNINRSNAWLIGYSGGSVFITSFLVHGHSDLFCGGGSIAFGGGGRPYSGQGAAQSQEFINSFTMKWYTGQEDVAANASDGYDALSDAKEGEAYYREKGFETSIETPAGIDHYSIPFVEVVTRLLPQ
ncbi:hypothetical protein JNJ66_00380 [Candidatus Saccharibacteria bacterium]|nr:hypothetical protein [Candidatus Saccharibacteria bacterium]